MVEARTLFLEKGHYSPLREAICEAVRTTLPLGGNILDAGCGEGYYTHSLIEKSDPSFSVYGVDVSKQAILQCCKRTKVVSWSVGSVYDLPFPDDSFHGVLSIFSPMAGEEFLRVLKKDGYLFMAIPLEDHLWELKSVVYDNPYKNSPADKTLPGFHFIDETQLRYFFHTQSQEEIKSLFAMTPYTYNTSPKDIAKLDAIDSLTVTAHFSVLIYQKGS